MKMSFRYFRETYGISVAFVAVILLAAVVLSLCLSCDPHSDLPDLSVKVCHIVCTDGAVVDEADYRSSGKNAIAVVFYINYDPSVEGSGYAIYLHDMPLAAFADTVGVSQGTSCDLDAYDGNSNTFSLYSSSNTRSPMAQAVFDMWCYGQSAYIPSVAQMRALYAAKSSINPLIQELGGEPLPDEPADCWYWSSTEVDGQSSAKAWLYSLASGAIQETPKNQQHKVRPIITINN